MLDASIEHQTFPAFPCWLIDHLSSRSADFSPGFLAKSLHAERRHETEAKGKGKVVCYFHSACWTQLEAGFSMLASRRPCKLHIDDDQQLENETSISCLESLHLFRWFVAFAVQLFERHL